MCDKVIKPATKAKRTSFVELVAFAPQLPKWFVSHWWGEPVFDFIACLRAQRGPQHEEKEKVTTRGWTEHCAYWVCAYANNQWNVEGELSDDPAQSSFRKALELAEGTVSILDRNGVVFSRVWCCYEIYVSLDEMGGRRKYEVYTAHTHKNIHGERLAVGFTDGLAEGDFSGSSSKSQRESHFPLALATRSFGTELQKAEATMPADQTRILNTIAGRQGAELQLPAQRAPSYDRLNAVLRGCFAASALRQLIGQGKLLGPCLEALKPRRCASCR